jgi:phospholipid/cholesterol/gamma-HCH transport system substrate-binding protein
VALVVILATALLFIQRLRSQAVIELVTYIPEDVSGLDVSSPVRYRGVSVGRVTEVRVDPRETTVEVNFEMFIDRLNTIGANVERIRRIADIGGIAPRLRARCREPRDGRGVLAARCAEEPPPLIALGFKPERF